MRSWPIAATLGAMAMVLLAADLTFLGVVAAPFYREQLGPLMRPAPYWPAALAFYALYLGAVFLYAVRPAAAPSEATRRGAGLGLVAYGTYELTNWAVLSGWPPLLVPVDLAWGVVLTASVAAAGRAVLTRLGGRSVSRGAGI